MGHKINIQRVGRHVMCHWKIPLYHEFVHLLLPLPFPLAFPLSTFKAQLN